MFTFKSVFTISNSVHVYVQVGSLCTVRCLFSFTWSCTCSLTAHILVHVQVHVLFMFMFTFQVHVQVAWKLKWQGDGHSDTDIYIYVHWFRNRRGHVVTLCLQNLSNMKWHYRPSMLHLKRSSDNISSNIPIVRSPDIKWLDHDRKMASSGLPQGWVWGRPGTISSSLPVAHSPYLYSTV